MWRFDRYRNKKQTFKNTGIIKTLACTSRGEVVHERAIFIVHPDPLEHLTFIVAKIDSKIWLK